MARIQDRVQDVATVFCLMYGDHFALHKRLMDSLSKHAPVWKTNIIVWANTVGKQTEKFLLSGPPKLDEVIWSDENVPKYQLMRKLFNMREWSTPWFIWFDDDSYVDKPDWWDKTVAFIDSKQDENICYLGQQWYVHHLKGQWDFIQKAKWFQGRPPEMCPTRKRGVKKPGITFAQGAYWWLRADVQRYLNWPDERLVHNGGDTLLGEAIRQQGWPFHKFHYGVAINKAKRRGRSDRPAGSAENVRR